MCGIIGYVGDQEVVPVVLEGLRRLEYRGYDSAGIAVVGRDGIEVRRSAGKLANLEQALREAPLTGGYGIGHTRWATHGRPTEENAHPHRDQSGRVVLVHNGIIENYLELKKELQGRGIVFRTETDTEVVAHLVGLELREDGLHAAVTRARNAMTADGVRPVLQALTELPRHIEQVLSCAPYLEDVARRFYQCSDFLFLGRGMHYPIALEGALKLKEISYIHAEGYPAGEMKHGPIALIDEKLPVVALAPRDHVFEKMLGNVQEVKARGGSIIAVTEEGEPHLWSLLDPQRDARLVLPPVHPLMSPITMTVPLQLLAYHVAIRRGCDVDQPRNLAKSVTVE